MEIKAIKQGVSKESLFETFAQWCQQGAGKKNCKIRIISAFVSGKGVAAISPLIDIFLADGNCVEIIFGSDRQGTDREAITRLYELGKAHPDQVDVKHFQAPSSSSIFHPKLYIYEAGKTIDFVVGSANLTTGGLGANFESLLLYEGVNRQSALAKEVHTVWNLFSKPKKPLKAEYLNPLTGKYLRGLLNSLPRRTNQEPKDSRKRVDDLWKPLSAVKLPRSGRVLPRKKVTPIRVGSRFLLMDVLTETRKTQMQIPLDVIENFFGIERDERHDIYLSVWTASGLTQPIERPLVISSGDAGRRLMRRLEMPAIKNMKRPLTIVFLKMGTKNLFAYSLFAKGSEACAKASEILDKHGQQGRAVRRYFIGSIKDKIGKQIANLLTNGT